MRKSAWKQNLLQNVFMDKIAKVKLASYKEQFGFQIYMDKSL